MILRKLMLGKLALNYALRYNASYWKSDLATRDGLLLTLATAAVMAAGYDMDMNWLLHGRRPGLGDQLGSHPQ
jgi:hypothetical protein